MVEGKCVQCSDPFCKVCESDDPDICVQCMNNIEAEDGNCSVPECPEDLLFNGKECVC